MGRVILAFVVVPFLYPLSVLVSGGDRSVAGALWVSSFTVPAAIVVGVPLFLLFRRRAWMSWWQFLVGGLIIGLLCSLPFLLTGWEVAALFAPYFAVFGLAHGVVFWLLAVWHNAGLTSSSTRTAAGGVG